ncbi:MAG: ATP-binding protein, partial [Alphaproteobacteria bacterium]|nr:ATP-binding protein [Alphaproteobacteria bacterium]
MSALLSSTSETQTQLSARPIIRQLDATLINQIAAGEVIERPAAALKELVENAIDAKATQVDILVRDGGKSLIQVIDNGVGMTESDM